MYSERTQAELKKRRRKRYIVYVVVLVLAIAGWFTYDAIAANLRAQGELSVRNAILDSAKQCCAIEGAYPSSLKYLENNYGLVVNRNDYTITYDAFAENVIPSIVVLAK